MRFFKKYFLAIILLMSLSFVFLFTACNNETQNPSEDVRTYWGTLSGTVTDYSESPVELSPVAGVTVKSGDETATTDENGSYSIKVYDNGATVSFEKEGRIAQSKTFKSSSFRSEEAEYDFIMYVSTKVQGTVKDKDGNALSGVIVSIGVQQVTTDLQGNFVFNEVIGTTMVIKATYNGKTVIKPIYTEDMLAGFVTAEIVME